MSVYLRVIFVTALLDLAIIIHVLLCFSPGLHPWWQRQKQTWEHTQMLQGRMRSGRGPSNLMAESA